MKSKLDQLEELLDDWIDTANRFETPFKMVPPSDYRDGRDRARGAFNALCFVRSKVRSLRKKSLSRTSKEK